jgi:hypothetical protein
MNIPNNGINATKSKFFREISMAFEFLAVYHTLSAERQETLLQVIMKLEAEQKEKG